MEKNVGGYDRIARLVLGPILIIAALAVYFEVLAVAGLLGAALVVAGLLVGAVFVVTGATQVCVLNRLLGIDTYRGRTGEDETPDAGVGRAH
ncbi:YgaP family membrane protein [Halosimplex amylolyticum]|uniref:YgaP family membrane protein n=1 Tax=Halosimplex amylolyticum TaxID=3396616 RepID=UPI003F561B7A